MTQPPLMPIFLSPSKSMSASPERPQALDELALSSPLLAHKSEALIDALRAQLTADERGAQGALAELMSLSPKLAERVWGELEAWRAEGAHPAALSYTGDVFSGLNAQGWPVEQWRAAQAQLWLLSGLYGALRPLDAISVYRLEAGLKLSPALAQALQGALHPTAEQAEPSKLLSSLLQPLVTQLLREQLTREGDDTSQGEGERWALNLASLEYSALIDARALKLKLCSPRFLDQSPSGAFKVVSRHAKRARGLMASYALSVGASSPLDLAGFHLEGYELCEAESQLDAGRLAFKRAARG